MASHGKRQVRVLPLSGLPFSDFPQRTCGGARNGTGSYFHHQLPIASDDRTATFLYANPGRDTDTELRSWAKSHRRLWTHLRDAGTSVHVAVVTRALKAQDDYRRILKGCSQTARPGVSAAHPRAAP